ncbi:MAG: DUF1508 domain-containing protein [Rhodothermales bacterium]
MRFQIAQNASNRSFQFDLQSDRGDTLLTGAGFASVEACTEAIRQVIAALPDADRFTVSGGRLTLQDAAGRTLAQSASLSADAARQRLDSLVDAARNHSEYEVLISRTTEVTRRGPAFLQFGASDIASLYRFERRSRSGQSGPESFQNEDDNQHYFHINDAAGLALLYSRGFNAASQRDKRLIAVLESASMEQRYEMREEDGAYFFILKARNGNEIARSRSFGSEADRSRAVETVMAMAPAALAAIEKPAPRTRTSPADSYVLTRASSSGQPGFESFRNDDTKAHYFHFNDDAGNALLFSQGYRNGKSRDNGIASIIKNSANRESYQVKEQDGQYYFVILAGNRQQIARSRYFASEADAERYIRIFMSAMPGYASAYGVDLSAAPASRTVTETERLTLAAPPTPTPEDTLPEDTLPAMPRVAPTPPPRAADAPPSRPSAARPEPAPAADDRGSVRLWLPWIIPLIALLLLLFLLRGCPWWAGDVESGMAANEPETTSTLPPAASAQPETPAAATPTPAPAPTPSLLGPNAAGLQLDAESLGGRVAEFLSQPGRTLPRTFVMDDIRFGYNAVDLNDAGRIQASGLAKALVAYPGVRLFIEGHADRAETDRQTLSTNRAKALYQFLIDNGVDGGRLRYQGFGSNDPISKGEDATSRQQNRRIAIQVQ